MWKTQKRARDPRKRCFFCCPAAAQQKSSAAGWYPGASVANIPRKERECQGMLEYRVADVGRLLKNVVTGMTGSINAWPQIRPLPSATPSNVAFPSDLKPRGAAAGFVPGLPAYVIFMCVRYADCVNDDQRVSALLNSAISSIKSVIKVT